MQELEIQEARRRDRPRVRINLPALLHPNQLEIARHPARYKIANCGRRWGKTKLGAMLCVVEAAVNGLPVWWVAPTFPASAPGWRALQQISRKIPGAVVRESTRTIEYPGGGWAQVKSADKKDGLRGEGLGFVVVDEAAITRESAWTHELRPALSDLKGRVLFISTPKGKNWFHGLVARGVDPAQPDWFYKSFPSSDNPHLDPEEIEIARDDLPELVFQQEYLAEFVDDAGEVFRNVMAAATGTFEEPDSQRVAMGIDWGKKHDFTVISVVDVDRMALIDMDRFNKIDYAFQQTRIHAMVRRWMPAGQKTGWHIPILGEANAMGEAVIDNLRASGIWLDPFETTEKSKREIIEGLAVDIERTRITFPPDPVLIVELQAFAFDRLPSGRFRYSAPAGMHDDCVISFAIARWAALSGGAAMMASESYGIARHDDLEEPEETGEDRLTRELKKAMGEGGGNG